jgi:hypothetical protein
MHRIILLTLSLMSDATSTSAQSVLERVLGQIDGATNFAQINGTYANIAESGPAAVDTYLASAADSVRVFHIYGPGPVTGENYWVTVGDLGVTIPAATTGFWDDVAVGADGTVTILNATDLVTGDSYDVSDVTFTTTQIISDTAGSAATLAGGEIVFSDGANSFLAAEAVGLGLGWDKVPQYIPTSIDGSITNIISGVTSSTAEAVAGASTATEFTLPTLDLGDMDTTALGAVNTGEITLGVNSAVDEASTSTTNAIAAVMTQIGGSSDTGALVLNVASNASVVNGSINNIMNDVNGSISSASTTALGAVNTGTITSGLNAVVQGITGMSGQSASSL